MYTTIEHFRKTFENEAKFTTSIMAALTDASLAQSECEGHRTLGRMAWHIINTYPEMMSHTGLDFKGFDPKAPVPAIITLSMVLLMVLGITMVYSGKPDFQESNMQDISMVT